jgi:hypothetical protein
VLPGAATHASFRPGLVVACGCTAKIGCATVVVFDSSGRDANASLGRSKGGEFTARRVAWSATSIRAPRA